MASNELQDVPCTLLEAAMRKTRHDLPQDKRRKIVARLNRLLASSIDLSLQAKQAHWNTRGPAFIALHELYDKVHDVAEGGADLLAERITALGGVAEGTLEAVSRGTRLAKYPISLEGETGHIEQLADAIAAAAEDVRQSIDEFGSLGDQGTADVATEIVRDLDQHLWFVESHLSKR